MTPSPFTGVLFHWLGGLAAASFYVPFRGVRRWSWETYWLLGGLFSWIVVPVLAAALMTSDVVGVLGRASRETLFWTWLFGVLWGLGGLTFGLSMRFLGMSLGYGVALGTCAVFGTIIPPVFFGQLEAIAASASGRITLAGVAICALGSGRITLAGVAICALGIGISALAGLQKERELTEEQKKASVREFNLRLGLVVAVICGVMSACMAFALAAGEPIAGLSAAAGTNTLWTGLPKLVVILFGGFTSNALWCIFLHVRNRSGGEYFAARTAAGDTVPRAGNFVFCALAGTTWYFQFFFYTMGETQMGAYAFSSWTLHMASIIIFSTLWGVALKEWKGTSVRAHGLIAAGIAVLVASTLVVGFGNYLGRATAQPADAVEELALPEKR